MMLNSRNFCVPLALIALASAGCAGVPLREKQVVMVTPGEAIATDPRTSPDVILRLPGAATQLTITPVPPPLPSPPPRYYGGYPYWTPWPYYGGSRFSFGFGSGYWGPRYGYWPYRHW